MKLDVLESQSSASGRSRFFLSSTVTVVVKSVGEARSLGFHKPSATRQSGKTSAVVDAVEEELPPEIAKCSVTKSALLRPVPLDEILELLRTFRKFQL